MVVANPRKVQFISPPSNEYGVMGSFRPDGAERMKKLLHPIQHRREQSQADLELLKARDQLVAVRRKLINPILIRPTLDVG